MKVEKYVWATGHRPLTGHKCTRNRPVTVCGLSGPDYMLGTQTNAVVSGPAYTSGPDWPRHTLFLVYRATAVTGDRSRLGGGLYSHTVRLCDHEE
jgi:hypothetical protein